MTLKKYCPVVTSLLSVVFMHGQPTDTTGIKMISEYGSSNSEITNVLLFQNIDYYRVKFVGKNLKNKYFILLAKEMWDGRLRKSDTLIDSKSNKQIGKINNDTLFLTVLGNRVDNKLKLFFQFPMVALTRKYKAIVSDDYSLRDVGKDLNIIPNKTFPVFAYILPYVEGNWKMYCAVDQSGVNVEEWGKKFQIKHYVIFEINFEE